ncbi:hypothetical protein [Treponema pectinovorum]|uniref:hypothetical protein n=1 Tax=Treponema pectinovorum TaxID=164 RepID=UPI0011C8FE16|nr:hypothetical protein [Treponema pectinovorum]
MKKYLLILLAGALVTVGFVSCNKSTAKKSAAKKSAVQEIIAQAENMSFDELCKKAIEESKSATLKGIGNSSRGKTAGAAFIKYLQSVDSSYGGKIEWSQPKNNSIFTTLNVDYKSAKPEYFMTLIQDGNQIQSKMMDTGVLRTFIPKEWAEANKLAKKDYPELLPLQTLNKVFMYNNVNGAKFSNCWDFVAPGKHGLFMGVNSELVGKNFLYMLTADKYSTWLKNAFDKLPADKKSLYTETINECEKLAKNFGLESKNAKYGLAFVKLWVENYNEETDDGPICNSVVKKSAADEFALIVYSKLRSVAETADASVKNISVAAYEDGYAGIGGYGYCHYLEVMDSSPYPWTACAFISFMVTKLDGFAAWGKDMGGYSANPVLAVQNEAKFNHSKAGGTEFTAKNDRGYDWWTSENGGELVLEDPKYCAMVSVDLGDWIDIVRSNRK